MLVSEKYLSKLQNKTKFMKIGHTMPELQPFTFHQKLVTHPVEYDKLYLLFQPNVPLVQVIIVHLHTVDPVLIAVRSVDVPKLLH